MTSVYRSHARDIEEILEKRTFRTAKKGSRVMGTCMLDTTEERHDASSSFEYILTLCLDDEKILEG